MLSWSYNKLPVHCTTALNCPSCCCCLAVVIGLLCGIAAFLADALLEAFNNWRFGAVKRVIKDGGGFWEPYLTFLTFCELFSFLAGCCVAFGAPTAAGSGVPEIKTYLNGVHIRGAQSASL